MNEILLLRLTKLEKYDIIYIENIKEIKEK